MSYEIEAVDLVDTLLGKFGMGVTPTGEEFNRAIELGLNVEEIKLVAEATHGGLEEDDECNWEEE